VELVVTKFIGEVQAQVAEKKVQIDVTEAARNWFAEHGYDRLYGARPMARLIQSKVKEPMAEEILFGKLQNGGHVLISEKDGQLELQFTGNDK
jgi:ATP-dependent Clp protease ATP-binding subunit ClpA